MKIRMALPPPLASIHKMSFYYITLGWMLESRYPHGRAASREKSMTRSPERETLPGTGPRPRRPGRLRRLRQETGAGCFLPPHPACSRKSPAKKGCDLLTPLAIAAASQSCCGPAGPFLFQAPASLSDMATTVRPCASASCSAFSFSTKSVLPASMTMPAQPDAIMDSIVLVPTPGTSKR